ncbi:MAG: formyl transferase [Cyanobacteria bacterium NC_groundwater_1444_Ag_S-0.65um_54_12]|nr:formyl transferase [Cyanobacteria bacterium NC_groundwater_1444_Ag_S-0.65um_54_12]
MKVLLLGPPRQTLIDFLECQGDEVVTCEAPITGSQLATMGMEFLISYGYRHILQAELLDRFPSRAINLHISLLPWNRGADPNLWSFLEDTPKGVTIHYLDPGIDTGAILAQRAVAFSPDDTLRTSYEALSVAIAELFRESWPAIRSGTAIATPQPPGGSTHRLKSKAAYASLLTAGWDTPVRQLIGAARCQETNHV